MIQGGNRAEGKTKRHLLLTGVLLTPLALLVVLYWAISVSVGERERMRDTFPPVGAGAAETGGANAIGEVLAGHKANASAKRHDDASGEKHAGGAEHAGEKAVGVDGEANAQPKADSKANSKDNAKADSNGEPKMVQPESLPQGFVLVVEDKSGKANASSPIYLAGTINNWNPADPKYKLEPQSDMRWRIELKDLPAKGVENLAFKFTRGDWKLEELKADLSPPGNRTLAPIDASTLKAGEPARIDLVVEAWGDMRAGGEEKKLAPNEAALPKVAGGRLARLQVAGGAGADRLNRDLLVWLPMGYDDAKNAAKKYPVLYMHDGQNLFAKHPGVPDEWGMDEAASVLIGKGEVRPFIVVGMPHSGAGRMREYLPVAALEGVTPEGDRHVRWLIDVVMPRVGRAFRVETGPENTGVGGSSLGAAIALYAATQHPEKFGLVLAESLPLRTGKAETWETWLSSVKTWPRRVFLGMGGAETGKDSKNAERNRAYLEGVQGVDKRMEAAGLGPSRRLLILTPDAVHNEAAWAKRLPEGLRFLFPPAADGTK